ncbi:MAG: DUF4314 domain-containing protein [Clostridia bacterium]|nr:DUF4314 domain-containing protein [Clostridia bacterium]
MEDRRKVEMIKKKYPVGTRIKLNYMQDDYAVPSGMTGTVDYVDDEGQIGMSWDNGRTLSFIYGVDSFSIIDEKQKALFNTKLASDMNRNGEIVEILSFEKGKDIYNDRYKVKFNDGTIKDNIMSCELNFNYEKKKDERSR